MAVIAGEARMAAVQGKAKSQAEHLAGPVVSCSLGHVARSQGADDGCGVPRLCWQPVATALLVVAGEGPGCPADADAE